jgi:DNA-binding ferritin-like protein (Dps family)
MGICCDENQPIKGGAVTMLDSIIKLIIGDMEEKRDYKQMMKRVDALPKDYRFAFRKIQHYIYSVSATSGDMTIFTDLTMFTDLVDLFEASAAEGRQVLDVIGSDVGRFCDEFIRASIINTETLREKLNKEVMEKFKKEGQ